MTHRLRRLTARFLAIGLFAATLFTVDSLAAPSPAEARCDGVNNPVTSWLSYGGVVVASETPGHSTCNGNNTYSGVIKDRRQDGYCVMVEFREAGRDWSQGLPFGGRVCGSGNTSNFQYDDVNDNSYVYQHFCIYRSSNFEIVACGWGDRYAPPSPTGGPYGVNHGF